MRSLLAITFIACQLISYGGEAPSPVPVDRKIVKEVLEEILGRGTVYEKKITKDILIDVLAGKIFDENRQAKDLILGTDSGTLVITGKYKAHDKQLIDSILKEFCNVVCLASASLEEKKIEEIDKIFSKFKDALKKAGLEIPQSSCATNTISLENANNLKLKNISDKALSGDFKEHFNDQPWCAEGKSKLDIVISPNRSAILVQGLLYFEKDWEKLNAVVKKMNGSFRIQDSANDCIDNQVVVESPMIEIGVRFIRVLKSTDKKSGFNILQSFNLVNTNTLGGSKDIIAATSSGKIDPSSIKDTWSIVSNQKIEFNLEKASTTAETLAAPFLTTVSGKKASFRQGGEVGVKIATEHLTDVVFRQFGINLEITPEAASNGDITCEVGFRVSAPEDLNANSSNDIIFSKTETGTSAILKEGESLVLCGMSDDFKTKLKKGVPFLRKVPLLRFFFSDSNSSVSQSELVIVITPRIAKGGTIGQALQNNTDPGLTPTDIEDRKQNLRYNNTLQIQTAR